MKAFVVVGTIIALIFTVCSSEVAATQTTSTEDAYTALTNRGLAEMAKRDWKGAIADFTKAIELKPDAADAYKNRASAEYAKGDLFNSRKDEAKAADLKNNANSNGTDAQAPGISWDATRGLFLRVGVLGKDDMASDISLATCQDPPPSFARGEAYRAYSGCALPRDQVAVLNFKGTRAIYVDGMAAYNVPQQGKEKSGYFLANSDSLELLPGQHKIRFVLFSTQAGKTRQDHIVPRVYAEKDIEVEAGKTYSAIWRSQATGRTSTLSSHGLEHTPVESEFWVEITDPDKSPEAYLQLYEADLKNGDPAGALSALEEFMAAFPKDPKYKSVDEIARKLRAFLEKAQMEAYKNSNSGPGGLAGKLNTAVLAPPDLPKKVLICATGLSGQAQEKTATPLALKGAANRVTPVDLGLVLSRATRYVQDYEAQLGNLIGEERYVQTPAGRNANLRPQRTESDFMILQVGEDWIGVREVNCLDGVVVKHNNADDFQKIREDSPAFVMKAIDHILRANMSYNIGFMQRNTNLPIFALRILRSANLGRFEFKKTGETSIGGVRTWAVSFQETQSPTLIHDGNSNEEFASGTLWIEPESGHILKTEVNDSGRQDRVSFQAQTVVSYKNNPKLGMLVPVNMTEHYKTDDGRKLDCVADYFNFHRFQVDTHIDFGQPVRPGGSPGTP